MLSYFLLIMEYGKRRGLRADVTRKRQNDSHFAYNWRSSTNFQIACLVLSGSIDRMFTHNVQPHQFVDGTRVVWKWVIAY